MAKTLLDDPIARNVLQEAEDALGQPFTRLMCEGPEVRAPQ